MPVFHLAVPAPQCHLAQGIILPPVSFPTLCDRLPAQPQQLPSMAPRPQSLLGVSLGEQALCERCDPATAQGIWSRTRRGAVILSPNVQLLHSDIAFFRLQKRKDKLLVLGLTL